MDSFYHDIKKCVGVNIKLEVVFHPLNYLKFVFIFDFNPFILETLVILFFL